ncbi:hypothetical protein MFLAVUS_001066 [Mucor flavus]|uniref:C2H2-type domain-containing protein n=1 Tax=Mucor flavus TaxID=439312 RepID=A0ABP9YLH6_9FUNG
MDDETSSRNHGRDKFRHERSVERDRAYGNDEYERYGKKRGRRSPTPPEERRHKRRPSFSPPPMRNYQNSRPNRMERDLRNEPDTDHYIPNYDRDGYVPGPRYGNKPEVLSNPSFGPNNPSGFPIMDMMNPQMVNQGWAGRFSVDPNQLDYLVPFKQFYDYTRRTATRRIDDDDMQKRYAHYKEKFAARQLAQFFVANKDKEWFQEKYHPKLSQPRYQDIKLRRRRYLNTFLQDLEKGEFDEIRFDKDGQANDGNLEEDTTTTTVEPANPTESNSNDEYETRLVIKTVPPTIPREKILEMCSKVEGFDYLALSEPGPNKKFHRIGWITFKEGTDMKKAFDQMDNQKVDDFVFHLAMNRKDIVTTRVPRIAPDISNTTERLQKDLEQSKELALAFETMLGDDIPEGLKAVEARAQFVIENRVKPAEEEEEEVKKEGSEDGKVDDEDNVDRWNLKKLLDMIIIYLRRVHMYCYYCALECDSLEELNKKCCEPHCRATASNVIDEPTDPKLIAKNERGVAQWAKNLDQKISMKIHTPDDRELKRLGGRVLQSEIDDYVKEHVLKEHESKYKCQVGECSKAFKGFDYVEKHILSKHPEEIDRIKAEVEYFNNYVCDPNHLIPSPNTTQMMNPMPNNIPFGQQPQPFMMNGPGGNMRPPPLPMAGMHSAVAGTPWDQIPRIGFGSDNAPAGWTTAVNAARRTRAPGMMDLEDSLPKDPRQVKSYVDLDAPAEGDSNISFY